MVPAPSVPTVLDVHLLGQARICVSGVPMKLAKRGTTLAMLAYLILQRGAAVPRETLAFTLFPDLTESEAYKELRRYLYLAQKALPDAVPAWIDADAETVRWNPAAPARIDLLEFERLAASGDGLAAAIDVYAGDLLPEIYDDWIVAERERLRALYRKTLSTLVAKTRSARDFARAVDYAQRLLAHDPWREDALRALMAARYEMGDAAGALAEYERFALSTRTELQVEPMPETRALREIVARGDSLPGALDRLRGESEARQPSGLPFAGRKRDFERLRRAWERAARGRGSVVTIEGEPGIGKSRLAAEFALLAEAQGARVLAGTTSFPEITPYQSVLEVLRAGLPYVDTLRPDALRTKVLAQVLPELLADAARARPPEVEAERQQSRLFDAIGATIVSLARARPLCVILEDLHWAGRGTLELLRALGRRVASATILIITTFRDEEIEPEHPLRGVLRDLAAQQLTVRVPLGRLSREDIAEVVRSFADASRARLDPDVLLAQSEGNPLFLSEAIHEALEPARGGDLAPGVKSVIERRLARLTPEARRIAAVAAICGTAFDADVVCNAAGANGAHGLAAIDELLERQIVREASGTAGFTYAFAHHLIAAELAAALPLSEQMLRHARVARALERFHQERLESMAAEIARHYDAAGEGSAAARWYARAARGARAIFAHHEVARFATLAIAYCTDRAERSELLLIREAANARLGRRAEQARDLDQLDREESDPEIGCESLRRRIALLRALDDRAAERAAIAALELRARDAASEHWRGVAACAQAWLEISLGSYAAAEPLARAAVAALDRAGSHAERLEALSALVEIETMTGRQADAERTLEQARAIAVEARDDRSLADVLMQAVAAAVSLQQFERAIAAAQQAAALYRSLGDVVGEARALVSVATAAVRQSHWEVARTANLRAATTFELAGETRGLARVLMNLAMLHGRCGAIPEARRYLVRAREHQRRMQDDRAFTASLLNESFLALWQGVPLEARALATQALGLAERMNHASYRAQALANLGAAQRDLGLLDDALANMEAGLALQLPLGRLADAVSDLADLALAYAMKGDLDRAADQVERILALDRACTNTAIFPPFPPWVAARVLQARSDSRARLVLAWAAQVTQTFSASIDVPELRATFLALPFVADIQAATMRDVWPPFAPPSRAVPHAGGTPG